LANPKMAWRPGLFVNIEVVAGEAEVPGCRVLTEAIQTVGDQEHGLHQGAGRLRCAAGHHWGVPTGNSSRWPSGLKAGTSYAASGSFVLKSELGKGSAEHSH
jgi:cobalt-zinc-cadmium efflux system membrane fusion protein